MKVVRPESGLNRFVLCVNESDLTRRNAAATSLSPPFVFPPPKKCIKHLGDIRAAPVWSFLLQPLLLLTSSFRLRRGSFTPPQERIYLFFFLFTPKNLKQKNIVAHSNRKKKTEGKESERSHSAQLYSPQTVTRMLIPENGDAASQVQPTL